MADVITKVISGNNINNGGAVTKSGSTTPNINDISLTGIENSLTDRFTHTRYYFWPDEEVSGGFDTGFDTGFG